MMKKKNNKNKVKLTNKGSRTHLIINGQDISKYVTAFDIKQDGGERPKITIELIPHNQLTILNLKGIDDIKIKELKEKNNDTKKL